MEPDYRLIMRACILSGADKFIAHLPDSLNTMLGEHGANLSGGERQRIALARALYKQPKLLILDEATSSLDSESERMIQQALKNIRLQGTTIVAIAHRLSTIMHADKIIVIDKGRVVEEGTHRFLMKRKNNYFLLWSRQRPTVLRKSMSSDPSEKVLEGETLTIR